MYPYQYVLQNEMSLNRQSLVNSYGVITIVGLWLSFLASRGIASPVLILYWFLFFTWAETNMPCWSNCGMLRSWFLWQLWPAASLLKGTCSLPLSSVDLQSASAILRFVARQPEEEPVQRGGNQNQVVSRFISALEPMTRVKTENCKLLCQIFASPFLPNALEYVTSVASLGHKLPS